MRNRSVVSEPVVAGQSPAARQDREEDLSLGEQCRQ